MKKLNILVVGAGMYVCGKGTSGFGTILPALYQAAKDGSVEKVTITAASQKSIKALKLKIKQLNLMFGFALEITCLAGSKAYLKVKADCAIVSVPDHLHFQVTSDLMRKGVHCLVVKPLAPTINEVKKLIALQQKKKVYGAVEFHKRFDRSNLKLKDTIRQGLIGDPLYFAVEYSQRKNVPLKLFKKWVNQTNIFQYLGIHYVDIIYFATQARPLRVMALGQKTFLKRNGINNYDAIQCFVEWQAKNGTKFTSTILVNWVDPQGTSAMSDQKIKVIGTKGRFEADQKKRGISIVTDEQGVSEPNPDFSGFYGAADDNSLSFQGYGIDSIHHFLKDVRDIKHGKTKIEDLEGVRPTFKESLVPTIILEAANQSLAQGGIWIKP